MKDHFNIGILYFTTTASHLTYQHMSEDPLGCHVVFYFLKKKKNQEQSRQIKSTFTMVRVARPSCLAGVIKVQQKEKAWSWLGT